MQIEFSRAMKTSARGSHPEGSTREGNGRATAGTAKKAMSGELDAAIGNYSKFGKIIIFRGIHKIIIPQIPQKAK